MYANISAQHHVCYSLIILESDDNYAIQQHCFTDMDSNCNKSCDLKPHANFKSLFECCCNGHLCNDLIFNVTGIERVLMYVIL